MFDSWMNKVSCFLFSFIFCQMLYNIYICELWHVSARTSPNRNWLWKICRIFPIRDSPSHSLYCFVRCYYYFKYLFRKSICTLLDLSNRLLGYYSRPKCPPSISTHSFGWVMFLCTNCVTFGLAPDILLSLSVKSNTSNIYNGLYEKQQIDSSTPIQEDNDQLKSFGIQFN